MRSSCFKMRCTRALLSLTQRLQALHPRQQHLDTGYFPLHLATLHHSPSRIWRPLETDHMSLHTRFLAKEKGQQGKTHTQAHPEFLIEDCARGTLWRPALLCTRPTFVQTSHGWPNFILKRSELQKMPGSQMKFVTLAQSPGRGAATGHEWGVWAEPHLEARSKWYLLLAPAKSRRLRHQSHCFPSSFELADCIAHFPQQINTLSSKKKLPVCSAVTLPGPQSTLPATDKN